MHLTTSLALALTLALGQTAAKSVTDVRQMYDAGKYRDAVTATEQTTPDADKAAHLQFLAAQSYDKLKDPSGAQRAYQRLADKGDTTWGRIGKSGLQLIDKKVAVIGHGRDALGEALFIRGYTADLTLLTLGTPMNLTPDERAKYPLSGTNKPADTD